MGMYDCITFNCPSCGEEYIAQSKGGACVLASYPHTEVPMDVACDANRHAPYKCKCGKVWEFDLSELESTKKISLPIKGCWIKWEGRITKGGSDGKR